MLVEELEVEVNEMLVLKDSALRDLSIAGAFIFQQQASICTIQRHAKAYLTRYIRTFCNLP